MRWLALRVWVLTAALSACQEDAPSCVVGASVSCACTDGRRGAQTCSPQRTLGPCVCTESPPQDAGDAGDTNDTGPAPDGADDVSQTGDRPTDTFGDGAEDTGSTTDGTPGADVVFDAGADATVDATVDAGIDATADTGADATVDTGADAPTDRAAGDDASTAVTFSGGFVAGGVTPSAELTGHFSWGATISTSGGGITLEGTFR